MYPRRYGEAEIEIGNTVCDKYTGSCGRVVSIINDEVEIEPTTIKRGARGEYLEVTQPPIRVKKTNLEPNHIRIYEELTGTQSSCKPCSCALTAADLFAKLHDLLSIYSEHARTGKLPATAREIREEIESASEQLKRVGESCRINIEHPETFLEDAIRHYESGLLKGDIHSLSEAAELAAEAELPLLRELWACREKEAA